MESVARESSGSIMGSKEITYMTEWNHQNLTEWNHLMDPKTLLNARTE